MFADPHRFDVRRDNAGKHLAFSGGRHFCLGAALARMEGEVGLRSFFDRFPHARRSPAPACAANTGCYAAGPATGASGRPGRRGEPPVTFLSLTPEVAHGSMG